MPDVRKTIIICVIDIVFATIPLDMRSESIYEAHRKDDLDVTKGVVDAASEKRVDAGGWSWRVIPQWNR